MSQDDLSSLPTTVEELQQLLLTLQREAKDAQREAKDAQREAALQKQSKRPVKCILS